MNISIDDYLDYLKQNNQQDNLSKYFTQYVSTNNSDKYNEFISPQQQEIELNLGNLNKINNPLLNSSSNKKGINIAPIKQTPTLNNNNLNVNIPKGKNQIGKHIINFFVNKGLTKEQASGIAGNLYHESSFNTSAVGDKNLSTPSIGIAQWRGGRDIKLKNFASSKGKDYTDLNIQLEYLWDELNSTEINALNLLKTAKSVKDASKIFSDKFERPKTYSINRENNSNYFYNLS